MATFYPWLALFVGANLALSVGLWIRARPDSGDRWALPPVMLVSIAMLIGILPKVVLPDAQGLQIAASIASIVLASVATIISVRRIRGGLRQRRRS